jgi:hypothetical protein
MIYLVYWIFPKYDHICPTQILVRMPLFKQQPLSSFVCLVLARLGIFLVLVLVLVLSLSCIVCIGIGIVFVLYCLH